MKNIKKIVATVCLAASLFTVQQCISVKAAANEKRYAYSYTYGGDLISTAFTQPYTKYNDSCVYFQNTFTGDHKSSDTLYVVVARKDQSVSDSEQVYSIKREGDHYLLNNVNEEALGEPRDIRLKFTSNFDMKRDWGATGVWSPDSSRHTGTD